MAQAGTVEAVRQPGRAEVLIGIDDEDLPDGRRFRGIGDEGLGGRVDAVAERPGTAQPLPSRRLALEAFGDAVDEQAALELGEDPLMTIVEALDAAGVALRSATEPIDTQGPVGRLLLQLLAADSRGWGHEIIDSVPSGQRPVAHLSAARAGVSDAGCAGVASLYRNEARVGKAPPSEARHRWHGRCHAPAARCCRSLD